MRAAWLTAMLLSFSPVLAAAIPLKAGSTVPVTATFQGVTEVLATDGNLADVAKTLSARPEARVRIEVFVDPTDPNALALSQKRAQAIVTRLAALGAPRTSMQAKGMGGTQSLVPSIVEALKAKNRRAVLRVLSFAQAAPKAKPKPSPVASPPPVAVVTRPVTPPQPIPAASTPSKAPETARPSILAAAPAAGPRLHVVYSHDGGDGEPTRAALERAGFQIGRVARVREKHDHPVLYVTPAGRSLAPDLVARSGVARGARLVDVDAIVPPADAMLVLSGR